MRSLSELQALAEKHGIQAEGLHRHEIMDALRVKLGTFDPELQIDPAKACDLKDKIKWGQPDRFAGIKSYFSKEWALEPKLDGARMRVFLGATGNTMNSGRRSDTSYTYIERAENFPHLRDAVVPELAGTILDGELMPPCSSLTTVSGVTTVGTLNSAMALLNVNAAASIATQAKYGNAVYVVFDVLAVKGESVVNCTYDERRAMLEQIMSVLSAQEKGFRLIDQFEASETNANLCLDGGFEGAMLKRRAARYLPGKRMSDWQKIKKMSTGDFFIIGSVDGKNKNAGKVGSMKVAWRKDGQDVYCADVAGITDAFRNEITGPDGKIAQEWMGRVIEVMAQGSTKNGRLRHPHFVRVRPDKAAEDCTAECSIDLFEQV